jgi:hypothetical protein
MYCSNCGNIIVGRGVNCTNCGAALDGSPAVTTMSDENRKNFPLDNISLLEKRKKDLGNRSSLIKDLDESDDPREYITIREREKRIIQERIQKDIAFAKLQSSLRENPVSNKTESAATGEPVRIIGEEVFIGSPEVRAAKKKLSGRKKMLITFGSFVTGVVVFFICMGYLFWRFAPPGDIYKNNFVEWMSANASGNVNEFLFDDMKLKDYYAPVKVIDYSGVYVSKVNSRIDTVYMTFKDGKLTGHYNSDGKEFQLKGSTDNKGEFLLLETYDNKPTATISGTLFSLGYLSAERIEQLTGRKDILSLEKKF